jgi:hypothetical protein
MGKIEKEKYFTEGTLREEAARFLEYVLLFRDKHR